MSLERDDHHQMTPKQLVSKIRRPESVNPRSLNGRSEVIKSIESDVRNAYSFLFGWIEELNKELLKRKLGGASIKMVEDQSKLQVHYLVNGVLVSEPYIMGYLQAKLDISFNHDLINSRDMSALLCFNGWGAIMTWDQNEMCCFSPEQELDRSDVPVVRVAKMFAYYGDNVISTICKYLSG